MGNLESEPETSRPDTVESLPKFYERPSMGLGIWGPLVPSADRPGCLFSLSTVQLLVGVSLFSFGRRLRFPKINEQLNMFQQSSKARIYINRFLKIPIMAAGGWLIFQSWLEYGRLLLPYDPYFEDAEIARDEVMSKYVRAKIQGSEEFKAFDNSLINRALFYWYGPFFHQPIDSEQWMTRFKRYAQYENKEKVDTVPVFTQALGDVSGSEYGKIKKMNKNNYAVILKGGSFVKALKEKELLDKDSLDFDVERKPLVIDLNQVNEMEERFDDYWKYKVNPWERLRLEVMYNLTLLPRSPEYQFSEKDEKIKPVS